MPGAADRILLHFPVNDVVIDESAAASWHRYFQVSRAGLRIERGVFKIVRVLTGGDAPGQGLRLGIPTQRQAYLRLVARCGAVKAEPDTAQRISAALLGEQRCCKTKTQT